MNDVLSELKVLLLLEAQAKVHVKNVIVSREELGSSCVTTRNKMSDNFVRVFLSSG